LEKDIYKHFIEEDLPKYNSMTQSNTCFEPITPEIWLCQVTFIIYQTSIFKEFQVH